MNFIKAYQKLRSGAALLAVLLIMVLAACADDREPGNTVDPPPPPAVIDGTWVAMGSFATGAASGDYDITLVLDETNGTIVTALAGENDITVTLTEPNSIVLSYSAEGDPSFAVGTFIGNQVMLMGNFGGGVTESLEATINGALDARTSTIRGDLILEFLDASVSTPITLVKQ
ncbi:MAG: hypothetical protein AAF267_17430 [Deinococcota bacterium]